MSKNCNNNIKRKLKEYASNYQKNPGSAKEMHKFYDRIIKSSTNSANFLFPRKEPKEDWSKYKTEEEYENSLKEAIHFSNKFTEKEKKSLNTIVFNRGNSDGVMSGYIVWKYLTNNGKNSDENISVIANSPNFQKKGIANQIKRIENKIAGKNVIMVDLSYNKETIEYIKKITNFFIFIDNHDNKDLEDLSYAYVTTFSKSGAAHGACAAVWKFFYPKEKVSYLIQSVDSGDSKLYIKYLPDPNPINTALAVKFVKNQSRTDYSRDPKILLKDINDFLMNDNDDLRAVNFLVVLGQVMDRFGENLKRDVASKATKGFFKVKRKKYPVYILNYSQPGLQKRIAKFIASQNEDGDFAVVWFYNSKDRSIDVTISSSHKPNSKINIVEIAKEMGGQGFKDTGHFKYRGKVGDIEKFLEF